MNGVQKARVSEEVNIKVELDRMSESKLLHRFLIMAVVIYLFMHFAFYYKACITNNIDFIDTDTYMRMVRVEQLYETGDWYDSSIQRSNAPYGEELHWSRLFDMILLAGALLGTPITGFSKALFLWGTAVSVLIGIASMYALAWAVKPLLDIQGRILLCILFISQNSVQQYLIFGRPDHHSLLIFLFVVIIGCMLRVLEHGEHKGYALLTGAAAAASVWVSVETLVSIIMLTALLCIYWMLYGSEYTKKAYHFSIALFFFSLLFLALERPFNEMLHIEYDKLSIVHVTAFALLLLVFIVLRKWSPDKLLQRVALLTSLAAICLFAMKLFFPDFYKGPFAGVNPEIVPIWLSKVNEVQPLFNFSPKGISRTVTNIGMSLVCTAYMTYQWLKGSKRQALGLLLTGCLIYVPLSFYQVRWTAYAQLLALIPAALLLSGIIEKVQSIKFKLLRPVVRMTVLLLFCFGFYISGFLIKYSGSSHDEQSHNSFVSPKPVCEWLNKNTALFPPGQTILASIDYGPEILYRTRHQVIATPYHRNDEGILYCYKVMTSREDSQVYNLLRKRQVDLILLCPGSNEKKFYGIPGEKGTFYQGLISGTAPLWIERVELPKNLDEFILYKIKSNN